jgi:hypothetical protein
MVAAKGSFTCPAATGNKSVTGVGFTPDAVIFFLTAQTAVGYNTSANLGVGLMTSGSQASSGLGSQNANTVDTNLSSTNNTTACLFSYALGGFSTAVQASRTSMDTDGFTINFSTVTSGMVIHYLAVQGLSNVAVGKVFANGSIANQSVTGLGFKPDAVLAVGRTGGAGISVGAATSAANRAASGWSTTRASGGSVKANQQQLTTKLVTLPKDDADDYSADLVSMDSGGFTIANSTVNFDSFIYLAVKGGTVTVGTDTQKTSTGTKSKIGLGAIPAGIMFFSANAASSTALQTTGIARLSVGATDATTGGCTWIDERDDGGSATASDQRTTTSAALGMSTGTATTNAEASISTMDADGYTLNWTTADATAREFIYLGFGGNPPDPIAKQFGLNLGPPIITQAVNRASTF